MLDFIGFTLVAIGLLFDVLGCIGIVRLPDVYLRLMAGTKCVTLGTCSILVGTFLIVGLTAGGVKCLLCAFFILLTDAVSAHIIARSAHRAGIKSCKETILDQYAEDKRKD
jgi:multicomponent Na+:H+ antiporter subunit G